MSPDSTTIRCSACGTELPPQAKFCFECAQPVAPEGHGGATAVLERILAATALLEGERKLVTILFADLKGSMELIAERDPEEARKLLSPVVEHMCHAVVKHGGTVNQVMGDGIMALFGAPVSYEDHAVRACFAALTMQDLVRHYGDGIQRSHGVPIQIRVGLSSGEVVLTVSGHGLMRSYTATGQPVHLAARMEQIAKPGTILASAETVRLVQGRVETRPLGPVKVKGVEKPVEVAEIARLSTRGPLREQASPTAATPFVGRDGALRELVAAFEGLAEDHAGRLAVIVGDAGMGKSRLVHEFLRAIARDDVLVLEGGAAPYGSGAGYRPGVHILRQYFDLAEGDEVKIVQEKVAGRIVALEGDPGIVGVALLGLLQALPAGHRFFGLSFQERRQRVFEALKWLATRITADHVLVLTYEDLQWATSDTRDFLDAFVREVPASTFVVLTYRPEYDAGGLERRNAVRIRLDGLDADATRRIVTDLLGEDPTLASLRDELTERSGGNPLFLEEYVRSMIESGALTGERGHYRLSDAVGALAIPPTVRAVLAARIDRLSRSDKHVLQILAAIGERAGIDVIEKVSDLPAESLRVSLRRLESAGLLTERTEGELTYEFRHSLIQAVAYDTLLRERRRELHLAIMNALADSGRFDVLARHAELGEAWEDAHVYLREAGRAAVAQFAGVEAVAYYERALRAMKRLPPSKATLEATFDLHCDLRNALVPFGNHERLLDGLLAARAIAEQLGDPRRLAQILSFLSNYYGNVGRTELAVEAGERALVLAEQVGAANLLIVGNMSVGEIHRTLGDYPKARQSLSRVLELIEPASELEMFDQVGLPSVRTRSHLAWTLAELGDFAAARAVAAEGIRIANVAGHPYSICHACLGLGGTRVRQGEFESAVSILVRGLALTDAVPLLHPPMAADLGISQVRCGQVEAGLARLDEAVASARSMGRLSRLALLLVKCGEGHLLSGDFARAASLAREALRLAGDQKERGNEVYARLLLAQAHARTQPGSDEAARGFAAALALADGLGMRPLAAHCHAGLADTLADVAPAVAAEHRSAAIGLYQEMSMRYWLERVRLVSA